MTQADGPPVSAEPQQRPQPPLSTGGLARPGLALPQDLDQEIWDRALLYHFIYAVIGLVLGLACVLCGMVLFLHGVAGGSSWTASFIGMQSSITDAGPGAVLFIVGLFVVLITRYNVRVTTPRKRV